MLTLAARSDHETEIKKSRFLAHASPAATPEAALAFLEAVRDPEASHNCWAYRVASAARCSDDGEPNGTAGRPILGAIEKLGLDQTVVVVTRHFGGIKLGAGGLARAYGGTAAKCLRLAPKRPLIVLARARLRIGFELLGTVYPLLERHGARKVEESFSEDGALLVLEAEEAALHQLGEALREASAGRARLEPE
jgi:uncharacterized YigZ family protein